MATRSGFVLSGQRIGGPIIRFGHLLGTHLSAGENCFDTVLALAQASEVIGLDAVFYSDHFQVQRHSRLVSYIRQATVRLRRWRGLLPFVQKLDRWAGRMAQQYDTDPRRTLTVLECFTTLAAIAAVTHRIRLGALVAGVPYRNPALLAKINITLDVISHGRCIVGLGAGWHEDEFKAYGWPFPSLQQRMDGLEEAVLIVKALMTQRRASYTGAQFQITEALSDPLPVQQPHPPILIGGNGERRTLQLVAQYADYSNLIGDPRRVARKLAVLRAHCEAIGRPYDAITRSNLVSILIAKTDAELRRKRKHSTPGPGYPIVGTPSQVIAQLQAFVTTGIQYVIFNLPDAHPLDSLQLFSETVMPAFASASFGKD